MSVSRYEELLESLRREHDQARQTQSGRQPRELKAELASLENRLLDQQTEIHTTATRLRLSAPSVHHRGRADDGSLTTKDAAAALQAGHREADNASNALRTALDRARKPNFLPQQRPVTRHFAVYALCTLAATFLQVAILASGDLLSRAWVFAAAPALALGAGYLLCGYADNSRIKPVRRVPGRTRKPTRHPKLGLIVCLVADFAVAVLWFLQSSAA